MSEQRLQRLTAEQRKRLAERLERLKSSDSQKTNVSLAAWFTTTTLTTVDTNALRSWLQTQLPPSVIPQYFEQRTALPRTRHGKLDRKRLTETAIVRTHQTREEVAFRTDIERQLFECFRTVLGFAEFSVSDNFFELGGDSMATIQVIALCSQGNLHITPGQFHENPSVRSLAALIEAKTAQGIFPGPGSGREALDAQALTRVDHRTRSDISAGSPRQEKAETTPALQGLSDVLVRSESDKDSLDPECAVIRLNEFTERPKVFFVPPRGTAVDQFRYVAPHLSQVSCLALVNLRRGLHDVISVQTLAERFLTELRRIQPSGPYRLAGMCEGAYIAWEMACLLRSSGEPVEFLGVIDTAVPASLRFKSAGERIALRMQSLRQLPLRTAATNLVHRAVRWLRRKAGMSAAGTRAVPGPGSRMGWSFSPRTFDGRATLFRAKAPPKVSDFVTDLNYGWGPFAVRGLDVFSVDHISDGMMQPEGSALLAERIAAALAALESLK